MITDCITVGVNKLDCLAASWFAASREADKRLEQARVETERKIASMVKRAMLVAEGDSSAARDSASSDASAGRAPLVKYVSAFLTLHQADREMEKKARMFSGRMSSADDVMQEDLDEEDQEEEEEEEHDEPVQLEVR
jgi:hypothetical protein